MGESEGKRNRDWKRESGGGRERKSVSLKKGNFLSNDAKFMKSNCKL